MINERKFKFEGLHIWQDAMELDSVALNISEGSIIQSKPEFRKFLGYSAKSLAEVVTCLHKAKRRRYISNGQFQELYSASFKLVNMIIAFRNKL